MAKPSFYLSRIRDGVLKDYLRQFRWIFGYMRKYWKAVMFYTLLGLTGTAISFVSSFLSRDMVDIITGQRAGLIVQTFVLYAAFGITNLVVGQFSNYYSTKISISVDNQIKADIFDDILLADLEELQKYHTGDLLTRWNADAGAISSGVLSFLPNCVVSLARFAGALVIMVYNDPMFALLAVLGMPVSALLSRWFLPRMTKNNQRSAAMSAKMSGFNQETFSNIQTIKGFDLLRVYGQRLRALQKEYLDMNLEFQRMSMVLSFIMSVVGMAVSYMCYGFGIYQVWAGAISYGTMTMFLSLSGMLTGSLNSVLSIVPNGIRLCTSASRLMELLELPEEDYSGMEQAEEFLDNHRETGVSLAVDDLSYAYKNGHAVFEHACMEAHPHEVVALVGASGEGKTTLLRLMLALLRVQEGEIRIQGGENSDVLRMTPSARCLFSYVPQGNTMLSGTIAENLRNVRPEATDEEITEVLKMACAWEFVREMPEGIYTVLGERGTGVSEGQAQRLSIARALLRKSPVLLLDEATSALDIDTERRVIRSIMADRYPRTCVVTTHRTEVLGSCTRVYRITEKQCRQETAEEAIHALEFGEGSEEQSEEIR